MAFMEEQRNKLDCRTPEGVYNKTLAQTDDEQLAEAAMTEAKIQLTMATLPQGGLS
jgi:hypothetical protein